MVRGSLRAPVARCPAAKAPQVVEIPGLACSKRDKKTTVRGEKVPLVGDAEKGGEGAGGWGGIGGRQPNKQKLKRLKNPTWGGPEAAAQLSWLESVALS
jgi:hypothetical protein